jgi:hypothetical protein
MRLGHVVHRESRTFSDPKIAKTWMGNREAELAKPGGMDTAKVGKEVLADAIDKYIATGLKEMGQLQPWSNHTSGKTSSKGGRSV